MARRVAMSLLAHPDDAEFLCAGTLARLAQRGWDVHIATVTAGDCGSATLPADEIATIRRCESAAAAALIGAEFHCLEESDMLVAYCREACRKAIDLLRRVAPTLVFTHPRRDYHLDHEQTHLLARSASFGYPIPNASPLPVREGSQVPWLYYCDPIEAKDPYTGELVAASTYVDVAAQMPLKTQMLACHASQREWLRAHHEVDEYLEEMKSLGALRGRELNIAFAEAFCQHRGHAFPQDNLLAEELGATYAG